MSAERVCLRIEGGVFQCGRPVPQGSDGPFCRRHGGFPRCLHESHRSQGQPTRACLVGDTRFCMRHGGGYRCPCGQSSVRYKGQPCRRKECRTAWEDAAKAARAAGEPAPEPRKRPLPKCQADGCPRIACSTGDRRFCGTHKGGYRCVKCSGPMVRAKNDMCAKCIKAADAAEAEARAAAPPAPPENFWRRIEAEQAAAKAREAAAGRTPCGAPGRFPPMPPGPHPSASFGSFNQRFQSRPPTSLARP